MFPPGIRTGSPKELFQEAVSHLSVGVAFLRLHEDNLLLTRYRIDDNTGKEAGTTYLRDLKTGRKIGWPVRAYS